MPPRHYLCYGLVAATVEFILTREKERDGAVLVFVQGVGEIKQCVSAITRRLKGQKTWVLGLHGSLSSEDQRRVFRRPPNGTRKIVVATNVAETSITIDDCAFVIDTGRYVCNYLCMVLPVGIEGRRIEDERNTEREGE